MKKGFLFQAVFSFCLFFSTLVSASTLLSISARLERDHILIGDTVLFTLKVFSPPGVAVTQPSFAEAFSEVQILNVENPLLRPQEDGGTVTIYRTEISTYSLDTAYIHPFFVRYRKPDGKEGVLKSDTKALAVIPLRGLSDLQPAPLKPPVFLPSSSHWLRWLLGIFIFLLLLALAIYLFYKFRKKEGIFKVFVRPPEEIALDRLIALRATVLKIGIKETAVQFSYLLRQYLEKGQGIPALEQPKRVIVSSLSKKISMKDQQLIHRVLEQTDLCKYAKTPLKDIEEIFDKCEEMLRGFLRERKDKDRLEQEGRDKSS